MERLPEIMTLEEVAGHLRVSERTVYDWAQKGEIPCGKFGTSWRFRREDINRWIDSQMTPGRKRSVPSVSLGSVLTCERAMILDTDKKAEALDALIDCLAASPEVKDRGDLRDGIYHREKLMSTGIGLNIAVPHVRLGSIKDVAVAVAISKKDIIDYESLDGLPVRLIFMIVARKDQHAQHLRILSGISKLLKDTEFRRGLIEIEDAAALYERLAF